MAHHLRMIDQMLFMCATQEPASITFSLIVTHSCVLGCELFIYVSLIYVFPLKFFHKSAQSLLISCCLKCSLVIHKDNSK